MKHPLKAMLVFFILLSTYGCEKEESLVVNVRIKNSTSKDMSNIIVNINNLNQDYNNLKGGEVSEIKIFRDNYLANAITFNVDGTEYELFPENTLALWEAPKDGGTYIYEIFLDSSLDYMFSIDHEN